ncbi:MAG: UPF0175 family protein [Planctomycetota bacterium]
MQVTFHIPDSLDEELKAAFDPPLAEAARDAFVVEGYRSGKLSLGEVALILAFETRVEAQAWLAQRHVPLNYDLPALQADRRTLGELFHVKL